MSLLQNIIYFAKITIYHWLASELKMIIGTGVHKRVITYARYIKKMKRDIKGITRSPILSYGALPPILYLPGMDDNKLFLIKQK